MTKAVTPNYTDAQTAIIASFAGTGEDGRLCGADAATIAAMPAMNKADGTPRNAKMIAAKISRMALPYERKAPARKDGSAVATKAALVERIALAAGVQFENLTNAARADLVKLVEFVEKAA